MPPFLTKDLEYSSVRNDCQILAPGPPPNGPSPTWANICWNMLLMNIDSKSVAVSLIFPRRAAALSVILEAAPLRSAPLRAVMAGGGRGGGGGLLTPRFWPAR